MTDAFMNQQKSWKSAALTPHTGKRSWIRFETLNCNLQKFSLRTNSNPFSKRMKDRLQAKTGATTLLWHEKLVLILSIAIPINVVTNLDCN